MSATEQNGTRWKQGEVVVNGVRLHYVEAGEGPLVLLLHGFPSFWRCWRHQIPALAANYHVVAPDMRGYNLSEKPPGVDAYHVTHLVEDTTALLRHFGGEDGGVLVGHDWGGLVAWYTASRNPEEVKKLVILNAPHPNRYLEVARESRNQKLRSTYIGFFQLPWLSERWLTLGGGILVEQAIRAAGVNPSSFPAGEAKLLRQAVTRPGAATAMLNYYRSMARRTLRRGLKDEPLTVQVPTLLLWGVNDVALDNANADAEVLGQWVPDLRVEKLEASHWVHWDLPGVVNAKILGFLNEGGR
jgi:pimeloyl-ACP methyl ester carboxylesterase